MKKILPLGPIFRLSIGIISLMLTVILVADAVFHILPNEQQHQIDVRRHVGKLIGGQIAMLLGDDDKRHWERRLQQILATDPDIRSIGVRRTDRTLLAASRQHEQLWKTTPDDAPAHMVIPLYAGKQAWGEIELLFAEPGQGSVLRWLRQPEMALILLLSTFGFGGVYFYLKRALYYLDPSNAMPQRVRKAFDTLTEAILVLNNKGQIMLGNAALHQLNNGNPERIEGKSIRQVGWLISSLSRQDIAGGYPWDIVLNTNQTIQGKELKVTLPDGSLRELMMNCSVINDGSGTARGCLITFGDVTPLSEANERLQSALHDLQLSKDKIQQQNEELQKFAHYDPLTSCLNRRAFFDRAEPLYQNAVADGLELSCIMVDIDHFKLFNDQYGHAVGDLVIQQVARVMERSIRSNDLLCRYGGEEFCLVLVETGREMGMNVAERLRLRIEKECGPGVRSIPGLLITASLGFASLQSWPDCPSLAKLIERADEGLYVAKRGGRNRVGNVDSPAGSLANPYPEDTSGIQAVASR